MTTPGLADPATPGPLDALTAIRLLERADELLAGGDFQPAGTLYDRVRGFPDAAITGRALLGLGSALYRLDRDDDALVLWLQVTQLPENPSTYPAWREVAAAKVRGGDLRGARAAYLAAERLAPPADRPEIASRLGWLSKETGDARSAGRYFARSRGGAAAPIVTYGLIAITVAVSFAAFPPTGDRLISQLWLDKGAIAAGEFWRLWTVTLVHGGLLHLAFNMYALYLAGVLVERIYGAPVFLGIYLVTAAAGSIGSFLMPGDIPSVGASGAIFGLFGVLLAVSRTHNPVLDRRSQLIIGQIGGLIVLNLLLGFGLAGIGAGIDNAAHVGGLVAGLWLGVVMVPGRVPTLSSLWVRPGTPAGGDEGRAGLGLLRLLAVLALLVVLVVLLVVGIDLR